jgi:hypothetical protein
MGCPERIVELFRSDPRLAEKLLESPLGVPVPLFSEARVETGTMAELAWLVLEHLVLRC